MYWTSAQLEQDTTMTWDWFNVCGGGKECCASSRWHGGIHHLSGKIRVPYPNHGTSSMLMSIHEARGACVRGWRSIASWGCDGRPSRRRWQLISGSQKVNNICFHNFQTSKEEYLSFCSPFKMYIIIVILITYWIGICITLWAVSTRITS